MSSRQSCSRIWARDFLLARGGRREKRTKEEKERKAFLSFQRRLFSSSVSPKLHPSISTSTSPPRGGKNSNKRSLRRPRRGEGSLPLARAHGPCQVEGGAHRVCGSGRVGHRDLLGDEDLWGRGEEGRRGPRRCRCGAGEVKKRPQPFATGGETHPAVLFSLSFSVLILEQRKKAPVSISIFTIAGRVCVWREAKMFLFLFPSLLVSFPLSFPPSKDPLSLFLSLPLSLSLLSKQCHRSR